MNKIIDEKYKKMLTTINSSLFTKEQKIECLKYFKMDLLNSKNTGRKVRKVIYGEMVIIPKYYIGKYMEACRLINKISLQKGVVNNSKNDYLRQRLFNLEPYIFRSSILKKDYELLLLKLNSSRYSNDDKNNFIRHFIDSNIVTINFLKGSDFEHSVSLQDESAKRKKTVEKKKNIIDKQIRIKKKGKLKMFLKVLAAAFSTLYIFSFASSFSNNNNNKVDTKESTSSIGYTSSNLSKSMFKKIKKVKAKLSVKVVDKKTRKSIVGTLLEIRNSKNRIVNRLYSSRNKVTINNLDDGNYVLKEIKPVNNYIKAKNIKFTINNNDNVDIVMENARNDINKENFTLNTAFTLKEDRMIYSTFNDSLNKSNGMYAFYNDDTLRKSMGYGINYNNNYITILKIGNNNYEISNQNGISYLTYKEAKNYLNKLINNGGNIISVISHCSESSDINSIEGFYSIDDIKVKKYV